MDVLTVIKREHNEVKALFEEFEGLGPRARVARSKLAKKIMGELVAHDNAEQETLYSRLREQVSDAEDRIKVLEGYEEHTMAAELIAKIQRLEDASSDDFSAKFEVLRESVLHHIKEEEGNIHKIARAVLDRNELQELGDRFTAAKQQQRERAPA